jgi:nucleoside-diphosphate-sugar epimerase
MAYGTYTFKGSINENTKWIDDKDNNNYGFSKHLAELEIQRGQEEGLETIIVNPALIIGENSQKDTLYNLQSIANGQYRFYPKGTNGFVKLADVSSACIKLMQSTISDEKFIISAENLRYQNVLEKLNPALAEKKLFSKSNSTKVNMICRWNSMKSFIFDSRPFLSQEMLNFHDKNFELDGSKICNSIDFKYSEI